jgi:hypothetical protein
MAEENNIEILKLCKICNEQKSINKFGANSHQCRQCLYKKNKDYHVKYYENNRDRLKTHQLDLYHIIYKKEKENDPNKRPRGRPVGVHKGRPKKYLNII